MCNFDKYTISQLWLPEILPLEYSVYVCVWGGGTLNLVYEKKNYVNFTRSSSLFLGDAAFMAD